MTITDDIFDRPPRAVWQRRRMPPTGRITCRVCDAKVTVPIDHPALLCPLCLEDMETTRARVAQWLDATLARSAQNQAEWQEMLDFSPARDRWARVQDAMIGVAEKRVDKARFDQNWAARKAEGGPLAELLTAYEAYARECDRLSAELARLGAAQDEINAAWLAREL